MGDLDEVMRLLSMRRHGRVEFIEQHFLAVLKRPVESSGEMRYDAPDHLEKRTLLPRPENLVLDGGKLTVERGGHSHVLDLHRYPQILPFISIAAPWPAIEAHSNGCFTSNSPAASGAGR